MQLEELNFKTIISKLIGHFFLTLLIVLIPPVSLGFVLPSIAISVATFACLVGALKRRNAKLYLLYYLSTSMFFLLLGLRGFEASIGLSVSLIISLLIGIIISALTPLIYKEVSELIYREQVTPQTRLGRRIFIVTLSIAPVIGAIGASIGRMSITSQNNSGFLIMGAMLCLAIIPWIHSGIHMYTSGRFEHWLNM